LINKINPGMTNQGKEVTPMLKELPRRIVNVDCLACNGNGSLNSYDSYSCPICQGAGFIEVRASEEVLLPKARSNPVIAASEEVLVPQAMAKRGGYEFCVEHL
jgi:DnaJ-class molecular chaperone